jgi:prevent-host-death family protein
MRFGALIKRVNAGETPLLVEKNGVAVAVVLSPADYERLLRNARLARFEQLSRIAGLDAEHAGLTEERLEQEMQEVRVQEHRQTYG